MIETYKNHRITIEPDENADNPDDWGNEEAFLVYEHKQFQVERKGFEPREIFDYIQEEREVIDYDDYFIFNVKAYIHSGVSLSLGTEYPFNDRFDVSTTGFVLVKKDLLKGSSKNEEDLTKEEAEKYAQGVIDTWNQYLSGEVYHFKIEKEIQNWIISDKDLISITTDGQLYFIDFMQNCKENIEYEEVDSCGGNYDTEEDILEQCKKDIDSYEQK
tara:strand:- start:7088 stop:7735 length:648 start_codon:yes stop_codon:yes gene_type:complete